MKPKTVRFGWMIAVLGMITLACTCGALSQAQEAVQTAEALATQGQALATQAQAFATQVEQLATQVEESGLQETAQALSTESAGGGVTFGEAPADIPIYEGDKQNLFATAETVSYLTSAAYSDILAFYKSEMPNNGWTQDTTTSVEAPGAAVLYFQKDNRKATVTLGDSGQGQVAVQILIEQ